MKTRIVWLILSCLMTLSLLVASCATAVTEEKEVVPQVEKVVPGEETTPPTEEEVTQTPAPIEPTEEATIPQPSGSRSELTDEVMGIASNFSDERTLSTLTEICYWIKDNFDCCIQADFGRHISKILETRQASGCHDYGVLFAALARAKGFKVQYIQTFNIDQIRSFQEKPETLTAASGHVFCEVWLNDNWVLIDPQVACLYKGYNPHNEYYPGGKVLYAKGLDSVEIGITDFSDMTNATREVVERVDLSDYSEPEYQRVMLMPGLEGKTGFLRIKVTKPDGSPCANLEVDLWTSSAQAGPPDAGYTTTDASGIAIFEVPAGDYKIGFNLNNFPTDEYAFPRQKTLVSVQGDETTEEVIRLQPR